MQCLEFAKRNSLIPLPNVIRDIAVGYLDDQLIPVKVIVIPPCFQVLMISGDDIYYRYDHCVYKNNTLVFQPERQLAKLHWFAYPVIGDWILLSSTLCNISTKQTITLGMQLKRARVFGDHLYYISSRYEVMRLSLHALDSVPQTCRDHAMDLNVVGHCLMFSFDDDKLCFHDSDVIYRGDYIYRWQNKVYEISVDGIVCNGHKLSTFDRDDVLNVFAVNEIVLIETGWDRYVLDCEKGTCQKLRPFEVLCDQPNRLWYQNQRELLIYH